MLRRLKRWREHIRYHSAPRPGNRWSRAMDVAFIASFLLAFPAALLADLSQFDRTTPISLRGVLGRTAAGAPDAWLMAGVATAAAAGGAGVPAVPAQPPRSDSTIVGNFGMSVVDVRWGWPLVTTIVREPASLTIDILSEPGARTNVPRDRSDEFQQRIEAALQFEDQDEALAAWNLVQPETRQQWWAWFPATGAWWIMMFAIAAVVIQVLRFTSLWVTGKRMQREYNRRGEGKCIKCGYDMTGLEFNERCPECGAHVW